MTDQEYCADCGIIKIESEKFTRLSKGGRVCEECADIRRNAIPQADPILEMLDKINGKLSFFVFLAIIGIVLFFFDACMRLGF